ncbi:MAG: protein kinase [Chromatiales bacterium]|jgi:eukaryotic-like serine/threonine-protein kinase|nr:protein kinase [Chromatiales bacterium]
MSDLPNKIGKYEVEKEIGRGNMGVVYSALDPFSNRKVALKVAHAHHIEEMGEQRFRKLFFNEARAAGVLDHPNILRIFDADMDGDLCYLVMELVPGANTLEGYCQPDTLLEVREIVGIIYKLAKALDSAHRRGVIHRDIKPSNILQTPERDVKLADFSIALVTRSDVAETQFDGFLGSPLYMSPEQINEQPIGNESDIFSLGVVMYQLLTGHHPFKANSLGAVYQKVTNGDPPALTEFRSDLPEGITYALRRTLKKQPSQRYSSGLDLAADLAVIYEDLENVQTEGALRERFGSIKSLSFFKGFEDRDIWELIRTCEWQTYTPDSTVIKEGDSDHSFFVVLSGVVCIEKNDRAVDTLQEGDCFGEMGYLSDAQRTATVRALTDVSLMRVNASTLNRAAEDTQLRFLKAFVKTLIRRLSDTTAALTQLNPV